VGASHPPGSECRSAVALSSATRADSANTNSDLAAARPAAITDAGLAESLLATALPATAWEQVLAQIQPNGTASLPTALKAFSLTYGRLPGLTEPAGRHGTVTSGTPAGEWILHYWSRLTAAQQRTVDRLLDAAAAPSSK
jgi:hypothetical protein